MVEVYIYHSNEYSEQFWRDERIDEAPMSLMCFHSAQAAKDDVERNHPGIEWTAHPKTKVPKSIRKGGTIVAYGRKQ